MDAQIRPEGRWTPQSYAWVFPSAPCFPGADLAIPALGQALPQAPLQGAVSEGAPHAASFWPREGSLCCSAVTSEPFDHGASLGLPVQPRAAPLQISPSPTHTRFQASRRGGSIITSVLTSASSLTSGGSILLAPVGRTVLRQALAPRAAAPPHHALQQLPPPKQAKAVAGQEEGQKRADPWPPTRCSNLLITWHKITAETCYSHWGGRGNRLSHLQPSLK